jgi:hypothetical protein
LKNKDNGQRGGEMMREAVETSESSGFFDCALRAPLRMTVYS